jgi:hypothetical protein
MRSAARGTRLLLYSVTEAEDFLGDDRLHATGVVSSVIGRKYGTAPEALAVHISGVSPAGYEWLAEQAAWIDIATTSIYVIRGPRSDEPPDTLVCLGADSVRSYVADGHIFFTSSGNTTDQPEPLLSPNGLPEVYQVGGADASGKTWLRATSRRRIRSTPSGMSCARTRRASCSPSPPRTPTHSLGGRSSEGRRAPHRARPAGPHS